MDNIICPKCGFNNHLSDAKYCQNCGIKLLNFCTNPECEITQLPSEEYSALPFDAKYCPYCGSKTTFFDYLNND